VSEALKHTQHTDNNRQ